MCLDDIDCCDLLCGAMCALCCIQMCKSDPPPPQTVVVHHQQPIYQQPQGYQTGGMYPGQGYPNNQPGFAPYPQQGYPQPGPVYQGGQSYSQGVPIGVQPMRSGYDAHQNQPATNPGFAPPPYN